MGFWKKFFGVSESKPLNEELENSIEEQTDLIEDSESTSEAYSSGSETETASQEELVEDSETEEDDANEESEMEFIGEKNPQVPSMEQEEASDESEETEEIGLDPEAIAEREKQEAEEAERQLQEELEQAKKEAYAAQLAKEQNEFLEDLTVLDGRILPQLKVPDWREELEFVKERYEPCDLSDHIVKVSKRRLTARQIDHELAQSRLSAYQRYLERASRRFKDKIDEDTLIKEALSDLSQWRSEQGKSVAWLLAERVNEEVLKAKQAEVEATSFVENNQEFTNPNAIVIYREFSRKLFLIPIVTLYIMSVVGLTYSRFEWILKFLPFFNLGLSKVQFIIVGFASYFLLKNFWRYSKQVAKIQKQLLAFNEKYQEQDKRIRHAVREHTRLSQQQPLVEPILNVLAKAYRVQLQSNVMAKVHTTTEFDSASLPACVTLARAVNSEEDKMARLKRRALNVLMTPGWRTKGLNDIARIHADTRMLDAHSLSLSSLDTDSTVSASNAQKILLEAFSNTSIHDRVSKERLVRSIKEIHREVLANWNSDDRPYVISLRNDGFNKIAFRTSWLSDEDGSEPWIPFLTEVLSEETAPFGLFNILDKRAELNMPDRISSVAVVPHYFSISDSKVKVVQSKSQEVMPLDVVVRVDVSPWSDPNAFAVFANDITKIPEVNTEISEDQNLRSGGFTGA